MNKRKVQRAILKIKAAFGELQRELAKPDKTPHKRTKKTASQKRKRIKKPIPQTPESPPPHRQITAEDVMAYLKKHKIQNAA
jgi:hypothetical protein